MANLNIGGVPPNLLASSVLTSSELAFVQNLSSRSNYNANNIVVMNSNNGGSALQILRVNAAGTGLEWANVGGGTIGGSISTGQVAFGTGTNTIGGDTNLTWDNTAKKLITSALKIGTISGVLKATTGDVSGGATTDDLPEGTTNLYWTQTRFNNAFAGKTTSDLAEGTNLYWTQTRFDTAFAGKTTDNLSEGTTNLYFTQARARNSISAQAPVTYNSSTGVIGLNSDQVITHIQINQQTGTAYTLVLSDDGKLVQMNNASANTLTIPTNSSVAFPVGTKIMVQKYGTGNTTISGASGVTIRDPNSLATITVQYDTRVIMKIGTNEWVII
jgi:hypothetical protein